MGMQHTIVGLLVAVSIAAIAYFMFVSSQYRRTISDPQTKMKLRSKFLLSLVVMTTAQFAAQIASHPPQNTDWIVQLMLAVPVGGMLALWGANRKRNRNEHVI